MITVCRMQRLCRDQQPNVGLVMSSYNNPGHERLHDLIVESFQQRETAPNTVLDQLHEFSMNLDNSDEDELLRLQQLCKIFFCDSGTRCRCPQVEPTTKTRRSFNAHMHQGGTREKLAVLEQPR